MKFKAIISDMDGLLIDSEHIGWICWRGALEELGYPLAKEDFLLTIGHGRKEFVKWLVEKFGPGFPAEEAVRLRVQHGDNYMATNGMPRKPGVDELLGFIKERQIPLGLATSTFREETEKRLNAAKIPLSIFKATVCGDEVAKTKPAPDVYLRAADLIGFAPAEILVLEDTATGATAALEAGMRVIAVPDMVPLTDEVNQRLLAQTVSLMDAVRLLESLSS